MTLDQPAAVRVPLDTDALAPYLERTLGLTGPLAVRQFPSGFSNLTYLVTVGDPEDGERELVLRRPPKGVNVRGGHDMGREYGLLTTLHGHPGGAGQALPVPEPLAYEATGEVLGAPFYVMERVRGVILRGTTDPVPDPATVACVANAFIATFARLHGLDLDAVGLADFGRPDGYVRRQVEGWTRRWHKAKTDSAPAIDRSCAWMAEHQPAESGVALIHNDFKHDNLVLDSDDLTRVRAILDWELATVGDPLMDLGSTLGYWVEPGDHPVLQMLQLSPTTWPGTPTRAVLVAQYEAATGRAVAQPVFYYVYGLVKLAVIAQQIYARWKAGVAQDPRFEHLIHAVRACGETATRAIERERISGLFE